jgi:CheY-like chemotaxis protein
LARKILLADDSVTAQNMGRKILADAGYEVITVNNGSAALKKIAELKPDLIILDVYMPGYSGLEVCSRLKDAGETSRLPVLLTVGKLEPFKPDEAKRVRADGFIVKPFEASELLSALSKLEDKIVPRAEASKSGRFARAIAAVDDPGRSPSDSSDDRGWKDRIGFPQKKEKTEEQTDDSAIYNALNKDLRTVIDPALPPAAKPATTHASHSDEANPSAERWIDVGTAALPGLPADVTAEEIAGLAAAMAHVQATLTAKESEALSQPAANAEDAKPETAPEPAPTVATEAPAAATFAEHTGEPSPVASSLTETIGAAGEIPSSAHIEATAATAAGHPEVAAAIAALEPASGRGWDAASGPENGGGHSSAGQYDNQTADVPTTMAALSRWTAVPVALAADEVAISLEQEMQQAYAAFVAAESAPTESALSNAPLPADSACSSPIPAAVMESVENRGPSRAEEELALALSAVANAPMETANFINPELANTAAQHADVAPSLSTDAESTPATQDLSAQSAAGQDQTQEAPELRESAPPTAEVVSASDIAAAAPVIEPVVMQAATQEEPVAAIEVPVPGSDEGFATAASISHQPSDFSPSEAPFAVPPVSVHSDASPTASEFAPEEDEKPAERHEPDLAATTAAAWANWRQIRSSSETRAAEPATGGQKEIEDSESAHSRDAAAMAVAAGAESSPEDVSPANEDDPAISSIVDSVLADLRPKIVEEISRKLRKKK